MNGGKCALRVWAGRRKLQGPDLKLGGRLVQVHVARPSSGAKGHEALIRDYPRQPGGKLSLVLILVEMPKRLDESILRFVLSVAAISQEISGDIDALLTVAQDQLTEGVFIPLPRKRDQLRVGEAAEINLVLP